MNIQYSCDNCSCLIHSMAYCTLYQKSVSRIRRYVGLLNVGVTMFDPCIECKQMMSRETINEKRKETNMDMKRTVEVKLTPDEIKVMVKKQLESEGYEIKDIKDISFSVSNEPEGYGSTSMRAVFNNCTVKASK